MPPRLLLLALLAALLIAPAQPARADVADGFTVSPRLLTASQPTAIAFSPDESLLFVAERTGRLWLADVSSAAVLTFRPAEALSLGTRTCANSSERGLLGVALDPNFTANRHFYLFYTYDKAGDDSCPTVGGATVGPNHPVNRVSRFTLAQDGTASLASERVLVDNMPSPGGNHNAGDIEFGKDGYLYIAIGDGGCDYAGGGCGGGNNAARDQNVLTGKILRIIANPDLSPAQRIPPTNPFVSTAGSTVCAVDGRGPGGTPISTPCLETFAYGLRNPFRMAFDPNTAAPTTTFYINDVGQGIWEEINLGTSGADYRWNACEGTHLNGTRNPCPAPVSPQQNPIHEYDHNDAANSPDTQGCVSITGGVVVPNGVWPAGYEGKYLFADFVCNKLFLIDPAAPQARTTFADALGGPIDLGFGPGPDGARALYFTNNNGIYRITPTAPGNRAPIAVLSANPQYGDRDVTFDGSGSSDPDSDTLAYLWNFGNGVTRETTTPTTSYTYPADGQFTATLQVRDPDGALSNVASIAIDTLNDPPDVTMTSPTAAQTFAVGDTITLSATASDAQDGALGASAMRWEVLLHHRAGQVGEHAHPFFGPATGNNLTFTAPSPEDLDAASNSYLEVRLTVTDSGGATTLVSRDLMPERVTLVFETEPAGLAVVVNDVVVPDGGAVTSWSGYQLSVTAFPQRAPDGSWRALSAWEDSSTVTFRTIVTPAATATYTATFGRDADLAFMPLVRQP